MPKPLHMMLGLFGLVLGMAALGLQAGLSVSMRMAMGDGALRAVVFYLSFFTVLSNMGVVLVYLSALSGWMRPLSGTFMRTMMAGFILVVMGVYHFILAPIWNPQGLARVADVVLHYVLPVNYLVWWITGPHKRRLPWNRALAMVAVVMGYAGYALTRGAVTGRYPYPFLDVDTLGRTAVAWNVAGLAVLFLAVSLGAVALSRWRHRAG